MEKYINMTLEQLELLDDARDDEIDEDSAFNSDDEKLYGKYFSTSKNNILNKSTFENISLPIPLQHNTVRIINVQEGHKLSLSSICLDVNKVDYNQIKLLYRCTSTSDNTTTTTNQLTINNDYTCLNNYLSAKNGGSPLQPNVNLNIQVVGPHKIEFKVEINPNKYNSGGSLNIFGIIVPTTTQTGYSNGDDGDIAVEYVDAFMSEEEEEESVTAEKIGVLSDGSSGVNNITDTGKDKTNGASKKRKVEDVKDDTNDNKKLTKKQRKKLAKEKAKQLEETLSASQPEATTNETNDANDSEQQKQSKKKKKKQSPESINESKWSGTRERRLNGGLVISDIVLGAGAPVKAGKRIALHYTGTLCSNGKVFDKNHSKQHPLVLRQGTGEVIRGLERGLEGMKAGGERVITIPSKLGYGSKGAGVDIPPDSDLVFEVKVVKVG